MLLTFHGTRGHTINKNYKWMVWDWITKEEPTKYVNLAQFILNKKHISIKAMTLLLSRLSVNSHNQLYDS